PAMTMENFRTNLPRYTVRRLTWSFLYACRSCGVVSRRGPEIIKLYYEKRADIPTEGQAVRIGHIKEVVIPVEADNRLAIQSIIDQRRRLRTISLQCIVSIGGLVGPGGHAAAGIRGHPRIGPQPKLEIICDREALG